VHSRARAIAFLRQFRLDRALQLSGGMGRATHGGFTLLEVIIATGLLTVIALGSAQLFALTIHQNMTARDHLLMTIAASRKIDQLAAASLAGTLAASPSDSLGRNSEGFFDLSSESGAVYIRRWLVAFPPEYGGAAAAIVVRVSRPSGGAGVQLVTVSRTGPP
jgi:prepilin-type N-terminal cleavage/methylation domain-containing protein